jgi:drug/metabolite transporter (DMT)-like permease
MVAYIWPIALIVLSNLFYNICAKSFPYALNPFAALTITYVVAALLALIMYFLTKDEKSGLLLEYAKANWVPFVFGLCLLGLEAGFIYTFKAGWPISSAYIVTSAFLSILLIVVGFLLYKEPISWNKIVGVAVCLLGLWIINR